MTWLITEIAAWSGEILALFLIFGSIPTYLIIRWYRKRRSNENKKA